jgi:hypothetical protein
MITRTVNIGTEENKIELEFQRLSLTELFSIADYIQQEREKDLRELCKAENFEKYELLNALTQLRKNKATLEDVYAFAGTPQGAVKIAIKSLVKSGKTVEQANELLDKVKIPDIFDTAKFLVLDIQEVKKDVEEEVPKSTPFPVDQSTGVLPTIGQNISEVAQKPSETVAYYGQKKE